VLEGCGELVETGKDELFGDAELVGTDEGGLEVGGGADVEGGGLVQAWRLIFAVDDEGKLTRLPTLNVNELGVGYACKNAATPLPIEFVVAVACPSAPVVDPGPTLADGPS
jgi:hypothetical protein